MGGMARLRGHAKRQKADMATQSRGHAACKHANRRRLPFGNAILGRQEREARLSSLTGHTFRQDAVLLQERPIAQAPPPARNPTHRRQYSPRHQVRPPQPGWLGGKRECVALLIGT